MKNRLFIAIPLASMILFSGCATVIGGGSSQTIELISKNQTPVTIYRVDTNSSSEVPPEKVQNITAPAVVTVSRGNQNLLLTSDNNEFEDIIIEKKLNPWFWGNFIPIGAINFFFTTTDAASGSMWEYEEYITIPEK